MPPQPRVANVGNTMGNTSGARPSSVMISDGRGMPFGGVSQVAFA